MTKFKVGDVVRTIDFTVPSDPPVGSIGAVTGETGSDGLLVLLMYSGTRAWMFEKELEALDEVRDR